MGAWKRMFRPAGRALVCGLLLLAGALPLVPLPGGSAAPEERVGRLRGVLLDGQGRPVAGARIQAWPLAYPEPEPSRAAAERWARGEKPVPAAETRTDANGQWLLTGLAVEHSVYVHAVQDGQRAGVAAWATPLAAAGPALRLRTETGRRVRGVLVDASGAGRPGFVRVTADRPVRIWGQRPYGTTMHLLMHQPTDADGGFEVVVPPGRDLRLQALVPGVVRRAGVRIAASELAVADPPRLTIPLAGHPGGQVEGEVRDSAGAPVANALVLVRVVAPELHTSTVIHEAVTRSDEAGRYRFADLTLGDLGAVIVFATGHPPAIARGRNHALAQVPLLADDPLRVSLVLEPGRSVRGTVVDVRGRPVPGVQVHDGAWGRGFGALPLVRTDETGRFVIPDAPTRALRLHADAHAFHEIDESDGRGVVVPAAGTEPTPPLRIRMQEGVTLAGRVVSDEGHAVPGAVVRVQARPRGSGRTFGRPRMLSAQTGDDGRFSVPGLRRKAQVDVIVDAGGFVRHAVRTVLSPASLEAPLMIELSRSCRVTGRVVDAAGAGLPGMSVYAQKMNEPVVSDARGRFELAQVPPGRQVLAVGPLGPPVATAEVELVAGEERGGVELRLTGAKALGGMVATKARLPQVGAVVYIDRLDGPRGSTFVRTGADGRFQLTHVPEGRYAVRAGAGGGRPLTVPAGARDLWLTVPATTRSVLQGTVQDRDGLPVPRAQVYARFSGDEGAARASAPVFDGRFRIAVPPSRSGYDLFARDATDARGRRLPLLVGSVSGVKVGGVPAALVMPAGHRVSGRVVDRDGAPVAGLSLTCHPWNRRVPPGGRGAPRTQTDAEGRFSFEGLANEPMRLVVQASAAWAAPIAASPVAPDSEDVVLVVARYEELRGRVLDETGAVLPDATVHLYQPPSRELVGVPKTYKTRSVTLQAKTDAEGRFVFSSLQPGLRPDLRVTPPAAQAVRFLALTRTEVDPGLGPQTLQFVRGRVIRGRVTDAQGRPLAGIQVTTREPRPAEADPKTWRADPALGKQTYTAEDGTYALGAYPEGTSVHISFTPTAVHRKAGAPWLASHVERHPVGAAALDVQLVDGVSIHCVVVDAAPADLKGFAFRLASKSQPRAGYHRFDGSSNEMHFPALAPGPYTLTVSSRPRRAKLLIYQTHEITAPATRFEIVPIVKHRLTGRMVGRDPEGYRAVWLAQKKSPRPVALQADGSFDLGIQTNRPGILVIQKEGDPWIVYEELRPSGEALVVRPIRCRPIKGRIRGAPEKIRQGTVTASRGRVSFRGTVAEDGWFEIVGVPAGEWHVEFVLHAKRRSEFGLSALVPAGTTDLVVSYQ